MGLVSSSKRLLLAVVVCMSVLAYKQVFAVNEPLFSNKIAVVVNNDVITVKELNARINRLIVEGALPQVVSAEVRKQVLVTMAEQLIQQQRADKLGVTISSAEWDQLMAQYAAARKVSVATLKSEYEKAGVDFNDIRNEIRASIINQKLLRRDAIRRVTVNQAEIEEFIKSNNIKPKERKYDLKHVFVRGDSASNPLLKSRLESVINGAQFEGIPRALRQAGYSVYEKKIESQPLSKLPTVFSTEIKSLGVGDLSNIIMTSSGAHILQLDNIEGAGALIEKRKAQHILISGSTPLELARANGAVIRLKAQLRKGEAFGDLAKYYSDDSGSAANGGDLGLVRKGQMVPEFEKALFSLQEGQISEPIQTVYGVHIIKLNKIVISSDPKEEVNEIAFDALMRRKVEQFYPVWLSELVANSYVQYM